MPWPSLRYSPRRAKHRFDLLCQNHLRERVGAGTTLIDARNHPLTQVVLTKPATR